MIDTETYKRNTTIRKKNTNDIKKTTIRLAFGKNQEMGSYEIQKFKGQKK